MRHLLTVLAIITPAALGILPLGCGEGREAVKPAASKPVKKSRVKQPQPVSVDDAPPPMAAAPVPDVPAAAEQPAPAVRAVVQSTAWQQGRNPVIADNPVSLAQQTEWAIAFLRRVYADQRPDIRMVSMAGIPAAQRSDRLRTLNFWLNNLHFESATELLREVPGSDGVLWWFFLSDFGWSAQAWSAVVAREPYFVEPFVPHKLAEEARYLIGVSQNPKTFSLDLIVRADWLFRDSVESDRSDTYFDLLFAAKRFPQGAQWETKTIQVYHAGGAYAYPDDTGRVIPNVTPGNYTVELKFRGKVAKAVNFPKNEKEWSTLFGADLILDFIQKTKINAKQGAVVDEGASIVARNNRLLESIRTPFGRYHKTFDVTATAGQKDFAETLFTDFQFDAAELIATLPAGGQAYLLTNAKGEIVTFADPKIAIDNTDPTDRRVRTPGSCVVCHARGWIDPPNLVEDLLKSGVDILFNKKGKARDARGFFLGWQKEMASVQDRYGEFVQKTSGWSPEVNAAKFKAMRDAYDAPITLEQAALETGVSVDVFKLAVSLAAVQGSTNSSTVRPLMLLQGKTIPRSVWEASVYREVSARIALQHAAGKE